MRKTLLLSCGLGLFLASPANAGVVAKYTTDFTLSGPPKTGWSYQWNATGPVDSDIGGGEFFLNTPNLQNLLRDSSGNFETQANTAYPDANPGAALRAAPTSVTPGQSSVEAADGNSRWVVVSYTIQASDIANHGANATMDTYSFGVPAGSADGIVARMYLNGFRILSSPLPPNFTYDQNAPDAYPIPFGPLAAGDTISVAIGAGATSLGDDLNLDFSITMTPEPGTITLAALAVAMLARRTRRTIQ